MAEKENTAGARTIREEDIGTVKIADDVVAMIAGYAAREVDGVAEMAGVGYTSQPLFGRQQRNRNNRNRGVRVDVSESGVRVDLDVVLSYGYNIPTTSAKIQQHDRAQGPRCQRAHCGNRHAAGNRQEQGVTPIETNES